VNDTAAVIGVIISIVIRDGKARENTLEGVGDGLIGVVTVRSEYGK